jgi:hypothetical protein
MPDADDEEETDPKEINPFDKQWRLKSSDIKQISYRHQDVWEGSVSSRLLQEKCWC